jgi:hypothetical protein
MMLHKLQGRARERSAAIFGGAVMEASSEPSGLLSTYHGHIAAAQSPIWLAVRVNSLQYIAERVCARRLFLDRRGSTQT